MPLLPRFSAKGTVIALVVLALFAVTYAFTLRAYFGEAEKRRADISDEADKDPNHVNVVIKLVSADLIKGEVPARIEFEPHGNLVNADGTLTRDLRLHMVGTTNKREVEFPKGKHMSPVDVTLDVYDGEVGSYPWDEHAVEINVNVTDAAKEKAAVAKTPAAAAADDETETSAPAVASLPGVNVPVAVDFYGSLQGYDITAARGEKSDTGFTDTDVFISRAPTVKFFSIFIMATQWGLTLAVVFLLLTVLAGGRKIELAMFTFMTALLFAFPTIRNAQPGVPPIGVLSDFIAFFWAELIIALCLLTLISTWLRRPVA